MDEWLFKFVEEKTGYDKSNKNLAFNECYSNDSRKNVCHGSVNYKGFISFCQDIRKWDTLTKAVLKY